MLLQSPPRVFISYSHDSESHKDWIRLLGEHLRRDGVDVILDQWEINYGDNIAEFMTRELASADWVLIICTEEYVKKAEEYTGGVGQETLIITSDIANNILSNKFIPIVRSKTKKLKLPSFLGYRFYADFSDSSGNDLFITNSKKVPSSEKSDASATPYEKLLRRLLNAPLHKPPELGENPFISIDKGLEGNEYGDIERGYSDNFDNFYWHPAVQEYCGNKLYFIRIRFRKDSILSKSSIMQQIRESNISDYIVYHLYSQWDILIRLWANESKIDEFVSVVEKNEDISANRRPEILLVKEITHCPEIGEYKSNEIVSEIMQNTDTSILNIAQNGEKSSEELVWLRENGMVLHGTSRFNKNKIQFYIVLMCASQIENENIYRIEKQLEKHSSIQNWSIYTTNTATRAILKGQTEYYYDIYGLLKEVTKMLEGKDIQTETMLVAGVHSEEEARIDFDQALEFISKNEFKKHFPDAQKIKFEERISLKMKYMKIRNLSKEKNGEIFVEMLDKKIRNRTEDAAKAFTFLFKIEDIMRSKLTKVIILEYEGVWQENMDKIKEKSGLERGKTELVFGDLCKIYKNIFRESKIVLQENELVEKFLNEVPSIRNVIAHQKITDQKWDELFEFWKKYIKAYNSVYEYIDKVE